MDSITQAVLGAGVAELTVGRKIGNKSVVVGAILATFPDLDVFVTQGMDPSDGLVAHRGFSHSLLFGIILSPLLAYILKRIFKSYDISLKKWMLTTWLVLFTHVLLDCFTTYGTGLFEPFSHIRIEWSTIAIVDIFYTIPFLVLMVILMFYRRDSKTRFYLKWAAVSVSSVYLLLTPLNKLMVNKVFTKQLAKDEIRFNRYKTIPLPLTNFLWMCIAETDSSYFTGYHSVFDKNRNVMFYETKKNRGIVNTDDKKIKKLIRFSKGWYQVAKKNNNIIYNDLRFGKMGIDKDSPFIFSFRINQNARGTTIEEEREVTAAEDTFYSYIKRIFGNSD